MCRVILAQNGEQLRSGNRSGNLMAILIYYFHISSQIKVRKIPLYGTTDDKILVHSPLPPPQVVRLREDERRLRLRCKELELRVGEGELSLKELKLATRRVILDADRHRTQQHQRHQSDIQLLLHKLKGETLGGITWWAWRRVV